VIRLKRVYEPVARGDGRRVLVERLWPRGVRKDDPRVGEWLRDVAPSGELRRWYGHDPARWAQFKRRYRAELRRPEQRRLLETLADEARRRNVTLVYAARDTERNSAVIVREALEGDAAAVTRAGATGRARTRAR
jgi:uncharacterized protein YeaO (DUF488 family)